MDSPEYHEFGSSNSIGEQRITQQKGVRSRVVYVLYGVLVLLLLILLLVTGIKFSKLNQDMADVKLHLETIKTSVMNGRTSSAASQQSNSGITTVRQVYLEESTPVKGPCAEGWVVFQSSCYLISQARVTWSKAEEQCRTNGGHLLVLNNVEELDYISKIIPTVGFWIGLVERQHEGHWSWVDGTDYASTPTFWDVGQPDNWDYMENGEDCGQLHGTEKRKRRLWNDADCSLDYRFICEAAKLGH
ncbi:C-type lectin domain family 4 member E-like isoform X1 [Centroberyx gerrardi]